VKIVAVPFTGDNFDNLERFLAGEHVAEYGGKAPASLFIGGHSLGAAVAGELAGNDRVVGTLLVNPPYEVRKSEKPTLLIRGADDPFGGAREGGEGIERHIAKRGDHALRQWSKRRWPDGRPENASKELKDQRAFSGKSKKLLRKVAKKAGRFFDEHQPQGGRVETTAHPARIVGNPAHLKTLKRKLAKAERRKPGSKEVKLLKARIAESEMVAEEITKHAADPERPKGEVFGSEGHHERLDARRELLGTQEHELGKDIGAERRALNAQLRAITIRERSEKEATLPADHASYVTRRGRAVFSQRTRKLRARDFYVGGFSGRGARLKKQLREHLRAEAHRNFRLNSKNAVAMDGHGRILAVGEEALTLPKFSEQEVFLYTASITGSSAHLGQAAARVRFLNLKSGREVRAGGNTALSNRFAGARAHLQELLSHE
jgi:hypothetical protein